MSMFRIVDVGLQLGCFSRRQLQGVHFRAKSSKDEIYSRMVQDSSEPHKMGQLTKM